MAYALALTSDKKVKFMIETPSTVKNPCVFYPTKSASEVVPQQASVASLVKDAFTESASPFSEVRKSIPRCVLKGLI